MKRMMLVAAAAGFFSAVPAAAQLRVYGPGGPGPAMKEAAAAFERKTGVKVEVTSGPTPGWIDKARGDADLVYSGSDTMMTEFVRALPDALTQSEVMPLYDRPSAILVRKGNPLAIRGFRDLVRRDVDVMVVEGAGQDGLWEDLASRAGGLGFLRQLRGNIRVFAVNSGEARKAWLERPEIDAWVIWNVWQVANPDIADQVPVEPDITLYRSMAVAPARPGRHSADTRRFVQFLQSAEGSSIFQRHGWRAPPPAAPQR
jgi:accessory colonization factor AcfC